MIDLRYQNPVGRPDEIVLEAFMSPNVAERLTTVRWILILFGILCALVGIVFTLFGARPVLGFMGVDIVLIIVAYRYCVRSSRVKEQLILSGQNVLFRRVDRNGNISISSFETLWLRAEIRHENEWSNRLILASKGRSMEVGTFLAPTEKMKLLDSLKNALNSLRTVPNLLAET